MTERPLVSQVGYGKKTPGIRSISECKCENFLKNVVTKNLFLNAENTSDEKEGATDLKLKRSFYVVYYINV